MLYNVPTAIIVDDDVETCEIFSEYLKIIDVKVVGVGSNGQEAVGLFKKYSPDLVFLDLMMPDYNGFYALENIRKINPVAKIVIITADMRYENLERLKELNPTRIILKPYDVDEIVQVIEEIRNPR
jgi:DNA-binding NarL/FixJ family response regulator